MCFRKYYVIAIYFLLSQPCFAEPVPVNKVTIDVLSYAMTSYLHTMLTEKAENLRTQYNSHISTFEAERRKEIDQQLGQKLAELNTIPPSLKEKETHLNAAIDLYNSLIAQAKQKVQEHDELRGSLNASIQRFNERNEKKEQLIPIVNQINVEMGIVNQHINQLNALEERVHTLWQFYNTQAYQQEDSIVQSMEDFGKWKESKERELEGKTTNYNARLTDFNEWRDTQLNIINGKKGELSVKQNNLRQFIQAVNTLIEEYNVEREKRCTTDRCREAISNKKALIERKKSEKVRMENEIATLSSQVDELTIAYNQKYDEDFGSIDVLRVEVETFSASIVEEQNRREQELTDTIEERRVQAKEAWEQAQTALHQRKESLSTSYGTSFQQFVDSFSHWSSTNQVLFESVKEDSISEDSLQQLQVTNNTLCEYQQSPAAEKAKRICSLVTQTYSLLSEVYSYYSDTLPEVWRVEFDEKTQELNQLKQRIDTLKQENDALKSEVDSELKAFNDNLPERENQYDNFSAQLTEELKAQFQKIQRIYHLKGELLTKEYVLIDHLLFKSDTENQTALDQKKAEFQLAVDNFIANIPEFTTFPAGFVQATEMLSTVIEGVGWDSSDFLKVTFSAAVGTQRQQGEPIEEDHKKQVVSSWLSTSFVSDFLKKAQRRISYMFVNYRDMAENMNIFLGHLFLEGVYNSLSLQKLINNGQAYYQVAIDDRLLLILPSGRLYLLE